MRAVAIVLLVLGGCSTPDDCQKAAAKLRPLVENRAHLHGELPAGTHMTDSEKDTEVVKLIEQCRAKRKLHPDDPMVTMNCLLAADDDDAVRACVAAAEKL